MLFHLVVGCFLIWTSHTVATETTPSKETNNNDGNNESNDDEVNVLMDVLPLAFVVLVGVFVLALILCFIKGSQVHIKLISLTRATRRTLPRPADDDGYLQVLDAGGGNVQVGHTSRHDQTSSTTDPTTAREPINVQDETHHYSSIYDSHYTNDSVDSDHDYNNIHKTQQSDARSTNILTQDSALSVYTDIESICIHTHETSEYTNIYDTLEDKTYTQPENEYSTPNLDTSIRYVLKNQNASN